MSPVAEPEPLSVAMPSVLLRQRLEDGEVVILAVRPSGWFVVLTSWPMLVGVAAIAAAGIIGRRWMGGDVDPGSIVLVCAAVAAVRVVVSCLQWMGRLYVLTDRRVMRIKGVLHEDCYQCPLIRIRRVDLVVSLPERLVEVGSLVFQRTDDKCVPDSDWVCLNDPHEVYQAIEEARRRAK